ncbi:hypothetical protein ACHAPK_007686 [Fusarium culmorum]
MPPRPAAIQEARPTVRLKNQDGTYKETQELIDFEASGGKPDDLLDDERWLRSNKWIQAQDPRWSSLPGRGFSTNSTKMKDRVIWNPEPSPYMYPFIPSSARTPESDHLVFYLVARACKMEGGEIGDISRRFRQDLGMSTSEDTTANSDIRGLYVGISASECLPVVLFKGSNCNGTSKNTVGRDDFSLGVDWDGNLGDREIIWLENMLIPGNIQYLKSAIENNITGLEKQRFLQIMKRENRLLEAGLNPTGVAKTLPSNESGKRKPRACRPIHNGPAYDTLHFKLRWPPMAALEFPSEMIDAMEAFLSQHPHDNVPLNIALAATIIYIDLENEGWPSEAFAKSRADIVAPPLAQFILYFPHMLRYVEVKHLTQFIHPAHFAASHYSKDGKDDQNIKIDFDSIDINKMRLWYSQVISRYPQVWKGYRFSLIPASMPGTPMVFPHDCSNAEHPSTDLFKMCCLNDIRTLGLPSYHHNSHFDDEDGSFRYIAGPRWLFSQHITSRHSLHGSLEGDHWRPQPDTKFMAFTGQARKIDSLCPDVSWNYYTDNKAIARIFGQNFGDGPDRAANPPRILGSTLSAAAKTRIETMMASATALSRGWDTMSIYLQRNEPTIAEIRRSLFQIHPFIVSVEELHASRTNGQGNLEEVLRLAYRAVGLDPQLALTRHENKWTSQNNAFSQFGQSIEQAIKDISVLKPLQDGFRFALPSIDVLIKSALIQDQVRIYKEIEALLDEEA